MSECVRAGQLKPQDVSNLVAKTFWQATAPQLSPVHSVRPEGTPYEVVLTVYLVWEVGGGGVILLQWEISRFVSQHTMISTL